MSRGCFLWICAFVVSLARALPANAQPSVVVRGDATCPSKEMILTALRTLRPETEWPLQTVTVEISQEQLSLTLDDGSDARRVTPVAGDCATRAESVALILATWSGTPPSQPTASPVLSLAPLPAVARPRTASKHVFEVDAGSFYSPVWGHAAGVWLAIGWTPRGRGLGFRTFGAYQSAQRLALDGGSNDFGRALLGATATVHRESSHFFGSADGGLVATMTRARGEGYVANETDFTFNIGAMADARLGLRLGLFRLWLDARLLRLFHHESIRISSNGPGTWDSAALSPWDVQLGLGGGVRFE